MLPDTADVVVIGGSLAGITTALLLARAGVEVVLLEAEAFDSPHGLGPVELSVVEHPHRTARALGADVEVVWAFTDRNKRVLESLGCFDRCGVRWTATDAREPEALQESCALLQARGRRAAFHDGLWLPDDGQLRDGARMDLVQQAREAGAQVFEHHTATLTADDSEVWVGEHRIHTELTVLAAGWGNAALDNRLARTLCPTREVAVSAPGAPLDSFERAGQGWTSVRSEGPLLTVSGARWATPHLEVGESEPTPDPRVLQHLQRILSARGGTGVPTSRCWITTSTQDQLPLIGPLPGQSRRLVATGFGTNPATWSFAAADAVVQGILHGHDAVPRRLSSVRLLGWRLG